MGNEPRTATTEPTGPVPRPMTYVPSTVAAPAGGPARTVFDLDKMEVYYGAFRAVRDVTRSPPRGSRS